MYGKVERRLEKVQKRYGHPTKMLKCNVCHNCMIPGKLYRCET